MLGLVPALYALQGFRAAADLADRLSLALPPPLDELDAWDRGACADGDAAPRCSWLAWGLFTPGINLAKCVAFGVFDTHVHVVSLRLRLAAPDARSASPTHLV